MIPSHLNWDCLQLRKSDTIDRNVPAGLPRDEARLLSLSQGY